MIKSNQIGKNQSSEKREVKNCLCLDGSYCMDEDACLVKEQYGVIDGKDSMDAGVMLK